MQSNNTTDESKGYLLIEGGKINITSGEDGIQAENQVLIKNGNISIKSGGGSEKSTKSNSIKEDMPDKGIRERPDKPSKEINDEMAKTLDQPNKEMNSNIGDRPERPEMPSLNNKSTENNSDKSVAEETVSTKAIKSSSNIIIEGGSIEIDSCDDSIHSNASIIVNGGNMNITSGDDGIHSDSELMINGGTINISKSYEGIESEVININDGKIYITSSDDGINAAESTSESTTENNMGMSRSNVSEKAKININGGYIYVDANGDGIDSNGNITMKDGTLIVNGPENNGNGSLDYDGTFNISGGTLIAAGSIGMAQVPSGSSTQKIINISLTSQEANTIVNIQSDDGKEIFTFAPSKSYQSVIVSTPDIKDNSKYTVSIGGKSTGKSTNGLYLDGKYSGGTDIGLETVSEIITNITQDGATSSKIGLHGDNRQPGGQGRKEIK